MIPFVSKTAEDSKLQNCSSGRQANQIEREQKGLRQDLADSPWPCSSLYCYARADLQDEVDTIIDLLTAPGPV